MSDRTFTLDEAQSLLPVLESLLRTAIAGKKVMEEFEAEQQALSHRIFLNGGTFLDVVALARRKAERMKAEQRAKDALAEIDSIGVQVKDIDIGLLDFPCEIEGQIILLCWKLGEKSITHWHGTQEGFASRKPIDDDLYRYRPARFSLRNRRPDYPAVLEAGREIHNPLARNAGRIRQPQAHRRADRARQED